MFHSGAPLTLLHNDAVRLPPAGDDVEPHVLFIPTRKSSPHKLSRCWMYENLISIHSFTLMVVVLVVPHTILLPDSRSRCCCWWLQSLNCLPIHIYQPKTDDPTFDLEGARLRRRFPIKRAESQHNLWCASHSGIPSPGKKRVFYDFTSTFIVLNFPQNQNEVAIIPHMHGMDEQTQRRPVFWRYF